MKYFLVIATIITGIALSASFPFSGSTKYTASTLLYIRSACSAFAETTVQLQTAIMEIDPANEQTISKAKLALKKSRSQYKKMEFFLCYFLQSATIVYNGANKFEVEEPFIEAREPSGFQVIEALLFSGTAAANRQALLQQASLVSSSATDIHSLLFGLHPDDKQVLESIRIELIRVMTLGITGYDAPESKTGIAESKQVLLSMNDNLSFLLNEKLAEADSVKLYLLRAIQLLDGNPDFDSFDRLGFLVKAALPLQYHLAQLIKVKGLELNTTKVLNYESSNLFSKDAIRLQAGYRNPKALIDLGRRLFFEKQLSEMQINSCATCHNPKKYFSDGLRSGISLKPQTVIPRNAPGLFYSTNQYTQFWDGRAKSLQEQIQTVLENPAEMGSNHNIIINRLRTIQFYNISFKQIFKSKNDSCINLSSVANAITAFLQTLSPMNSSFDRYLAGAANALTSKQKKGFNLFNGKAQCGTCHFMPFFNGLVPPLYNRTELEVLGVTQDTDFKNAKLDPDSGRYTSFPIAWYMRSFKTTGLRNIAQTAPYMHNGAFPSLEKVLAFYNKGGGAGLGLSVPSQTLSSKPLQLNDGEISAIISFLKALTDQAIK